jgi:hypothetical protein
MATDAKLELIGRFHGSVKSAPEKDAGEETDD